ncbi:hypothetical protein EJ04DRAFT_578088 [Polyplosphaeria fusca]|uniref:Uncharacterized protein n=1 Tax=Polyplosphaeria fusca TaxID=682080 RepID=A0A9P4QX75_9PLEO|nr:hypothetical protein EJ04DRAFT_578088 [Polyplosphaeria fusca]
MVTQLPLRLAKPSNPQPMEPTESPEPTSSDSSPSNSPSSLQATSRPSPSPTSSPPPPPPLTSPAIPPDIQLAYFLAHLSSIPNLPVKSHEFQTLATTRAIFYHRLAPTHQFQRHHDITRFNITLFLALLTAPPESLIPTGHAFAKAYLHAVLEHHSSPTVFEKRDGFVKMWKKSGFDLWTRFRASEKRLLKRVQRERKGDWEEAVEEGKGWYGEGMGREKGGKEDGSELRDEEVLEDNELLRALRVPYLGGAEGDDGVEGEKGGETVVDSRVALKVLKECRVGDMLNMLIREFGEE